MTNTNFPKATIEGYPRVGANRELKRALESYWAGRIDAETFESAAHSLRLDTYNRLRDLGLTEDYAIPADVAYYDQVLETALTVGAIVTCALRRGVLLGRDILSRRLTQSISRSPSSSIRRIASC